MIDPVWSLALRAGLALLLVSAAAAKLRDLRAFTAAVAGYRLLPAALAGPVAIVFAAAEAVIALGLWLPALRPCAALSAAALLSLYGLAIAINLVFYGLAAPFAAFPSLSSPSTAAQIATALLQMPFRAYYVGDDLVP